MVPKKVILGGAAVVACLTGYALAKNKDDIEEFGEAKLEMAKDKIEGANDTVGESFESAKDTGEKASETMKGKIEEGKDKLYDFFKASEQFLQDDKDQKTALGGCDLAKEEVEKENKEYQIKEKW